jgi:drug/metabolite transporter (DMT)-like permease
MTKRNSTALRTSFALFALFSASVFWGGNAVVSKILYRPDGASFDAVTLIVSRSIWSLPLFLGLAWFARPDRLPSRRDWALLIATGVCFGPGACGFLALAAQYTSGSHISMLFSLGAPVTAVLSAVALKERVDLPRIAALVLGIAGAALLSLTRSASGSSIQGDLLELVQVLAFSLCFVFTRALGTRYSPFFITGAYGSIGMSILLAAGIIGGHAAAAVLPFASGPATIGWFFGEIIIGLTIYGQTAQTYALRTLGAGITGLLSSYGTLFFGLVGSVLLLGERLAPAGYIAAAMLAVALGISLIPQRRAAYAQ